MPLDVNFEQLILMVRAGDNAAAAEFFRRFEPHVRRLIRVRLTSPSLRRTTDSIDVCQSVMADFLIRVTLGQFEMSSTEDVFKLLAVMARNKVIKRVEKERAARRDVRRMAPTSVDEMALAGGGDTPSRLVAANELLSVIYTKLTGEERYLVEQRANGREWKELAEEMNTTPEAIRKRVERTIARVSAGLGLND